MYTRVEVSRIRAEVFSRGVEVFCMRVEVFHRHLFSPVVVRCLLDITDPKPWLPFPASALSAISAVQFRSVLTADNSDIADSSTARTAGPFVCLVCFVVALPRVEIPSSKSQGRRPKDRIQSNGRTQTIHHG